MIKFHPRWPVAAVATCIVAAGLSSTAPAAAAGAADPWPYVWPVEAPIVDEFRAPPNRFGPGNRGLEFATSIGQVVVAPRHGVVTFAGQVAGDLFVTVLHPDGVRTTAGFLASVAVRRGHRVATGQAIGTAAARLHVSARIGDAYVDPAILFAGATGPPRLVMVTPGRSATVVGRVFVDRFGGGPVLTGRVSPSRPVRIRLHSRPGAGLGA